MYHIIIEDQVIMSANDIGEVEQFLIECTDTISGAGYVQYEDDETGAVERVLEIGDDATDYEDDGTAALERIFSAHTEIAARLASDPIRSQVVSLVASLSPMLRYTARSLTNEEIATVLLKYGWKSWDGVLDSLS